MTARNESGVLTITSWGSRAAVGLWMLILVSPFTFVVAACLDAWGQSSAAHLVGACAAALVFWRVLGQRCVVSETELVVHDVLRTRRFSRGEIRSIRRHDPTWGVLVAKGQSPGWWLRVELLNGKSSHPGALARLRDHSDWHRFASAMDMAIVDVQPV